MNIRAFGTLLQSSHKIQTALNIHHLSKIYRFNLPAVKQTPTPIISTMTHPKLDQAVQKVDEFLAAYPTLCQYDRLRDLEKKTGQPKAYLFFAIVSLITTIVMSVGGSKLFSDIFAFVYPAYMSFKAIDSSDATDDTQWLTYWVVFASFSITESVMTFIVSWIPFYYIIKSAFFMWLYHPKFMGAGLVYKQIIKPFVMPHLQNFEHSKPQKKEE